MNDRERALLYPTYYISVLDNGRVPIRANSSEEAYRVACNLYGADRVVNDAVMSLY